MGKSTGIQWTDATFNPWWGCAKVSPGCDHCYAETFARRYGHDVWGIGTPRRFFGTRHWHEPEAWNAAAEREGKRRRVFCASMADVFEDRADLEPPRRQLWALIDRTPHLDWQLLTKRPQNIERMLPERWWHGFPENVWLGASVEDQANVKRARWLRSQPGAVRFLSCEPLIGPLTMDLWADVLIGPDDGDPTIDWVIVGGESGPRARPMHEDWVRAIVSTCRLNGVAVFVKQLGSVWARENGARDGHGGDWSEWAPDLRVREFPAVRA